MRRLLFKFFSKAFTPGENLCEVLDNNGKTLALLSAPEIKAQNLRHRSVALLVRNLGIRYLLRISDDVFGFFAYAPLPAKFAADEFCTELLQAYMPQPWQKSAESPKFIKIFEPCKKTGNSFVSVFEIAISNAAAQTIANGHSEFLFADYGEITALARREYSFHPLLLPILEHLSN